MKTEGNWKFSLFENPEIILGEIGNIIWRQNNQAVIKIGTLIYDDEKSIQRF